MRAQRSRSRPLSAGDPRYKTKYFIMVYTSLESYWQYLCLHHQACVEQVIEEAIKYRILHVIIDFAYPKNCVSSWTAARIHTLKKTLISNGLKPVLHSDFRQPLASDDNESRLVAIDGVKRELHIASELSAPLIIHPNCYPRLTTAPLGRSNALDAFINSLVSLTSMSSRLGVEIWVENMPWTINENPYAAPLCDEAELRFLLQKLPTTSIFFDIGHANIGFSDPIKLFTTFFQNIRALFLNDNDGKNDSHQLPGDGIIDFLRLFNEIQRLHWQGLLVFEIREGQSFNDHMRVLNRFFG
jgi:sugar phosphate isomerase/epimerase